MPLHKRQGDMDGACAVYSLAMAMLCMGVVTNEDLQIYNCADKRTRKGKLLSHFLEGQGLVRNGYSFVTMAKEIRASNFNINAIRKNPKEYADVINEIADFLDEDNPLYIWQVSGLELNDLNIVDAAANSMAERMQSYINEGTFTEKELERQAKAEINNADETESIPIDTADVAAADNSAAEVSGCSGNILIFVLIVLVIIAATGFFVFRKRKGH